MRPHGIRSWTAPSTKALLSLVCCAVDQVCLDGGNWTLASQYRCLPEPPWNFISRTVPVTQRSPFTELADPPWSAALLGYLRDVDAFRNQRKAAAPASEEAPPPKRQGKGRAKRGGSKATQGFAGTRARADAL